VSTPLIKTAFAWWPIRLARHVVCDEACGGTRLEFIGWVWWRTVVMYRNMHDGWITVLDATPLRPRCRKCGQELPE